MLDSIEALRRHHEFAARTRFGRTPKEARAEVTRHAAQALGLARTNGALEVGKRADPAIWGIDHLVELSCVLGADPCSGVVRGGETVLDQGGVASRSL